MDRSHGVKGRDRRQGFDNSNLHRRKPAVPQPAPTVVGNAHPRRTKFLQALIKQVADGDLIEFAALSDLPVTKIRSLSEGEPLSDELAFHLKEVFELPANWSDTGNLQQASQEEKKKADSQERGPAESQVELVTEASSLASSNTPAVPAQQEPAVSQGLPPQSQGQTTNSESSMTPTKARPSSKPSAPVNVDSEDMIATRQANLNRLTSWHGAKKRLAAVLGEEDQLLVTYLLSGRKKFWGNFASAIEQAIDLPPGWFSTPDQPIPESTMQIMQAADPAHPNPVKVLNVPTRKYTRKADQANEVPPAPSSAQGSSAGVKSAPATETPTSSEAKPEAKSRPAPKARPAPAPQVAIPPEPEKLVVPDGLPASTISMPAGAATSPAAQLGQVICSLLAQRINEGSLSTGVAYKVLGLLVEDR